MLLPESVDVLIVGAGHVGLAISSFLTEVRREHLVVERRDRLGGAWQDRWEEFTLVTPNWTTSFPGWAYDGADPDGFMSRAEVTARVARYAEVVGAPVALGTTVQRLTPAGHRGFRITTNRGQLTAREVVVATGSFHTPRVPPLAKHISDRVTQIHSHNYWNEVSLPDGAVLIIGSAQTGVQLAEELFEAGRPVYISVGSAGRVPRRYRGRDIFSWICDIFRNGASFGVAMPTVDNLPDARSRLIAMPALSGHNGGHDTNLRQFAADGMTLAGRLTGADGERLTFANDLAPSLARTDNFFEERVRGILDRYIDRARIEAPPAENSTIRYQPPDLTELNLLDAGISTIIWATGYGLDYQWIDAPILDELGFPRNVRGVTEVPGLYFLGLLWQHSQLSASLVGPEFDGPYLLDRMRRAAA